MRISFYSWLLAFALYCVFMGSVTAYKLPEYYFGRGFYSNEGDCLNLEYFLSGSTGEALDEVIVGLKFPNNKTSSEFRRLAEKFVYQQGREIENPPVQVGCSSVMINNDKYLISAYDKSSLVLLDLPGHSMTRVEVVERQDPTVLMTKTIRLGIGTERQPIRIVKTVTLRKNDPVSPATPATPAPNDAGLEKPKGTRKVPKISSGSNLSA